MVRPAHSFPHWSSRSTSHMRVRWQPYHSIYSPSLIATCLFRHSHLIDIFRHLPASLQLPALSPNPTIHGMPTHSCYITCLLIFSPARMDTTSAVRYRADQRFRLQGSLSLVDFRIGPSNGPSMLPQSYLPKGSGSYLERKARVSSSFPLASTTTPALTVYSLPYASIRLRTMLILHFKGTGLQC
jgi:hypothetical protein